MEPRPQVHIRLMRPGEERRACAVARAAFRAFVAPGYSARGRASFRAYARPEAMAARCSDDHFALVAVVEDAPGGESLVGVLEIRYPAHVSMLFVEDRFQRRGLARRMLREARSMLPSPPLRPLLTVHAAPNAVAAYERLGFIPTGPEESVLGVRYVPMREAASGD